MTDYVLKQADDPAGERQRLARIQALQDPPTVRFLEAIGVTEGWRCLDAGAGAGSIATWLAERVGPSGSVLATDLEIDQLSQATGGYDNLTVQRHDIRHEPLPRASLDLAHARLLLIHLPERDEVLQRMIDAVRPGGWVVVGDIDFSTVRSSTPIPVLDRVIHAFGLAVRNAGWDPELGPRLPEMFERHGLHTVEAESWQMYQRGGSPAAELLAITYRRLRPLLLATGAITESELDDVVAVLADPAVGLFGPTIWTARGRV